MFWEPIPGRGIGLATARQQASGMALSRSRIFRGLSALGAEDSRPSIDYVRAGDVIRVYVAFHPAFYLFNLGSIGPLFIQNLGHAFNVIRAPAHAEGARAWIVDVQPRSDYARLDDVKSVVLNAAQNAGLSVAVGASYAQFVSKVEAVGTTPPASIPTPGESSNGVGSGSGIGDTIGNFFSGLTQSPVTLAVILGAAVILVIAAKK